jgi:ABC-type uncharacterized transport system auxiliary subunit
MTHPRASRVRAVLLAACAGLALAGCAGRARPETRYYTLAISGAPAAALPGPVRVGVFTADEPYAGERIAYRTSPYRLDYYSYHRWAAKPRTLVATALRDYLERAAPPADGLPLEIVGHIRRLEEVDEPAGWSGALALDLGVRRGGNVLLERTYAETEPAGARNLEAVAAALSRALGRILDRFAADLAAVAGP